MADPDFFPAQTALQIADLQRITAVEAVKGELPEAIVNAAELDDEQAPRGSIGFVKEKKYLPLLQQTTLSAVIVPAEMQEHVPKGCCTLVSSQPRLSFASVVAQLYPQVFDSVPAEDHRPPIHPTARIADDVRLGHGVIIGAHAQIGAGTQIGDYSVIGDHVHLGLDCRIGRHNTIRYARIGDDFWCEDHNTVGGVAYAFEPSLKGYQPLAQLGLLRIGNGVHILSGCSLERGALGDTVIGDFVQIGSLSIIGHNVRMGSRSLMISQSGIAGSAKIGQGVQIASRVGINGFIEIGDGATILASSTVHKSVEAKTLMVGTPARRYKEFGARELAVTKMVKQFKKKS